MWKEVPVTQVQLIHDLDEYAVWFSFLMALVFPPVASAIWKWWGHPWGWNIVTLEIAIAFALLPAWLGIAFGLRREALYVFGWIQFASVVFVGLVIAWRLALIWSEQRHPVPPSEPQKTALLPVTGEAYDTCEDRRNAVNFTFPRSLSLTTNPAGLLATAGAVYAAAVMIYNAVNHHGVIDTNAIVAAVGAVGALLTRQVVTPVSDPKNGAGVPLVPAPALPLAQAPVMPVITPRAPGTDTQPMAPVPEPVVATAEPVAAPPAP